MLCPRSPGAGPGMCKGLSSTSNNSNMILMLMQAAIPGPSVHPFLIIGGHMSCQPSLALGWPGSSGGVLPGDHKT